ncbi:unnamed protein product [Absidia cylindrospora]
MDANTSQPTSQLVDDVFEGRVRWFTEFMESKETAENTSYRSQIAGLLASGERRLLVSIDTIRQYDRGYAKDIINNSNEFLPAFDKALKELVLVEHDPLKHDIKHFPSTLDSVAALVIIMSILEPYEPCTWANLSVSKAL